jgi:heme-degrading monooxygenase HmoA
VPGRPPLTEGQVVTVFRSRRRADAGDEYHRLAAAMLEAARAVPGFVDFKQFAAEDGEQVSVITFDSEEAQRAWRDDPGHRAAQVRGRESFYAEFSIQTGRVTRARSWRRPDS